MSYLDEVLINFSSSRLELLLSERLGRKDEPEKQKVIDQRIWDLFGEQWCIMFTDLSGFSKNAERFGIIHFLQTIKEAEKIYTPVVKNYDGFVAKTDGDSLIVIFRSSEKAVKCAVEMQRVSASYNKGLNLEDQIILCCGLGWGKILRVPGYTSDVFGEEVNFSAKLGEDVAEGGEILITEALANNLPEIEGVSMTEVGLLSKNNKPYFKLIYE